MTDQDIKPYLGKAVRVTLADRRVLAGKADLSHFCRRLSF
jgi:hypothetical protein